MANLCAKLIRQACVQIVEKCVKLYVAERAPSPAIARQMVAFKKANVDEVIIDMQNGENRQAAFLKVNPAGQLPCLETDAGMVISELTAIAEYLEEIIPDPVIVGSTAEERAQTRMWMRRADFMVLTPMMVGFQHGKGAPFFEGRITIYPEASAPMMAMAQQGMAWFDQQLAGRAYLCGDRFTYADLIFHGFASFFIKLGQPLDPDLVHLTAYLERVGVHPALSAV